MCIYLDHNATTPLDARVLEAMQPFLTDRFGNPSAVYGLGRQARAAIDAARDKVAALVGVHASQVIFTSGGTEANNLALKGVVDGGASRLVVSAIEHASVLETAKALRRRGADVMTLGVEENGVVRIDSLPVVLQGTRGALLSVMAVNNETGVIQPVAEIAQVARRFGAWVHTDAVQAAGKLPLDFSASGVHLMSLSAHKISGPKGVGALIVDKAVDLVPLLHGGGHEKRRRAGTENVAAIVGFGAAAAFAAEELVARRAHAARLQAYLEDKLKGVPGAVVFGASAPRIENTVFFGLPGIDGETLLMNLDQQDIAVSSGSACESGSTEPSHVLVAMGVDESLARGAVRVSFGRGNDEADIDAFVAALIEQVAQLRAMSAVGWA